MGEPNGSTARIREILEGMPSAVAIYRAVDGGDDFVFMDINPAGLASSKLPKEAVVGRRVTDVFPGVADMGLLDVFREVLKTGLSKRHPIAQYRDERISLWVDNYVFRLPGGEVVAVYDDVTERENAKLDLEQSRARYRALFRDSPVPLLEYDVSDALRLIEQGSGEADPEAFLDRNLVSVLNSFRTVEPNDAAIELLGARSIDEIHEMGSSMFPEFSLADLHSEVMRFLSGAGTGRFETGVRTRDGRDIRIVLNWRLHRRNGGGEVLLIALQDVTDRAAVEAEARASRDELRRLTARSIMALEAERKAISRRVHDDLGQTLTALRMEVAQISGDPGADPDTAVERLRRMEELLDSGLQTVQSIARELRPGVLDELGLAEALKWESRRFEERSDIACEFVLGRVRADLPDLVAITVFRVFQEIMTNVARHSGAESVKVSLTEKKDRLFLAVEDDGVGITGEQAGSRDSLGIIGMRERLHQVGGRIRFSGRQGRGTAVTVSVPVGPEAVEGGRNR